MRSPTHKGHDYRAAICAAAHAEPEVACVRPGGQIFYRAELTCSTG